MLDLVGTKNVAFLTRRLKCDDIQLAVFPDFYFGLSGLILPPVLPNKFYIWL